MISEDEMAAPSVLGPNHLGVRVTLHLDFEFKPGPILDGEVWFESREEGGWAHEAVVGEEGELLGVPPAAGPAHRVGRVRSPVGFLLLALAAGGGER